MAAPPWQDHRGVRRDRRAGRPRWSRGDRICGHKRSVGWWLILCRFPPNVVLPMAPISTVNEAGPETRSEHLQAPGETSPGSPA
jgi:hypothetical protein